MRANRFNVRMYAPDPSTLPRWCQDLAQKGGLGWMVPNGVALKAHGVPSPLADFLIERLQKEGGFAEAQPKGEGLEDVSLAGKTLALQALIQALNALDEGAARALAGEIAEALQARQGPFVPSCRIGGRTFTWGERTYVMGILNVTPDSFSGDGLLAGPGDAPLLPRVVSKALQMLAEGADILDIGGESTRPGAAPVDAETEISRIVPAIRAIRAETDAPLSVDTYKASVARAALDAGADMVNDVWGLRMDPEMAPLVAERRVPLVIMHNRSKPHNAAQEARLGGRYIGVHYEDLLADILRELRGQITMALEQGIVPEQILVDPGIGFGKTVEQNLSLLNHLGEFRVLGYPLLIGPSRKSFIGYTLNLPPEERLEGTLAAVVTAALRGTVHIVRVHDVQATVRALGMVEAIQKQGTLG